jgi:hypothetical protein
MRLSSSSAHALQRWRVVQKAGFLFVCWLAYDFHVMYVAGFAQWVEWQHAGAFVYMGALVGAIKVMFDDISKPVVRDHD